MLHCRRPSCVHPFKCSSWSCRPSHGICFPRHGIQSTWFIKERNSNIFTIHIGRIRGGVSHPCATPTGCRYSCSCSAYPTRCSRSAARPARRRRQVPATQREASCPDTEALRPHLLLWLCRVSTPMQTVEEATPGYDACCKRAIQMFQRYVANVSYGYCKRR
jgi:hypothetical protein